MIIQKNDSLFKGSTVRFRPNSSNGIYIKYVLKSQGLDLTDVAKKIDVSQQMVQHVIYGRRRSRRVQSEIARILGHDDWNDLVIEAQLVTSGVFTPTKEQIQKAKQDTIKEITERITKSRQRQFAKVKTMQANDKVKQQHVKEVV